MLRGRRSTYGLSNTEKFLPYIKQLMADPANGIEIPRSGAFASVKLSTLYVMWQGALQYLIEGTSVSTEQRQAAALIKSTFIAKENKEKDALVITPRTGRESSPKHTMKAATQIVSEMRLDNPSCMWKEEFLEWVASGEVDVIWMKRGLALNGDDIDFVRNICDQNGWEHDVTINQIKVVKT